MHLHHIIKPQMYVYSAQPILDWCNVQYTLFLYVCSELLYVILPGARQLKKFWLGWWIQKTTTTEKRETKKWKEAQRRWIQHMMSLCKRVLCKRVLVCAFVDHPHTASPWLKPAVPWLNSTLSMSSPFSSDYSSKRESLGILTASTRTGPKRKIFRQGT